MVEFNIPKIDSDDTRAVSPVIGVILMVAITVILAAVIGAFVLNLGQSVGDTAPRASISVEDAGDAYSPNDANGTAIAYINHQTGDDIKFSSLKIVVTNENGANVATFNASSWNADDVNVTIDGSLPDSSASFSTGDQLVIQHTNNSVESVNNDAAFFTAGTTYTLQFIDTKSGQTITTAKVTIK